MKKKVSLILIVTLFMLTINSAPLVNGYATDIRAHRSMIWEIEAVPSEPFLMYYSNGGYWLAENYTHFTFQVSSVEEDVEGSLSLGNMTVLANDTEIAKDLTLGVWGTHTEWWPGLLIEVTSPAVVALNETAYAAAERVEGNYLNGTMESRYETIKIGTVNHSCIVFDYEQDPPGNQITHLAYSLTTGVLIEANTSFTFGTPYNFAFRFDGFLDPVDLTANTGGIITLAGIVGGGIFAVIVVVYYKLSRSK